MNPKMNRSWSFDWRSSPPHLTLLALFFMPRSPNDLPELESSNTWTHVLGEEPEKAIERFQVQGVLKRYYPNENEWSEFTVKKLRSILREKHLPVSGNKKILIDRLVEKKVSLLRYSTKFTKQSTADLTRRPEKPQDVDRSLDILKSALKWSSLTTAGGVVEYLIGKTLDTIADDALSEPSPPRIPQPVLTSTPTRTRGWPTPTPIVTPTLIPKLTTTPINLPTATPVNKRTSGIKPPSNKK